MKEIRRELLDELLEGYEGPEDLLGDEGVLRDRLRKGIELNRSRGMGV